MTWNWVCLHEIHLKITILYNLHHWSGQAKVFLPVTWLWFILMCWIFNTHFYSTTKSIHSAGFRTSWALLQDIIDLSEVRQTCCYSEKSKYWSLTNSKPRNWLKLSWEMAKWHMWLGSSGFLFFLSLILLCLNISEATMMNWHILGETEWRAWRHISNNEGKWIISVRQKVLSYQLKPLSTYFHD